DGLHRGGGQADLHATLLVRGGGISRMPSAVDDEDRDLALALRQRGLARREVLSERRRRVDQLRVVHPHLVGPGQPAARTVDEEAVSFALLRRHPVDGNLGIASERRCVAHVRISLSVVPRSTASSGQTREPCPCGSYSSAKPPCRGGCSD